MHSLTPLLAVKSVSKRYESLQALSNLSLSVNAGEFVCLLGPNGSGKSTFLKILAGTEPKSAGEITYRGHVLNPNSPWQKDLVMVWQSLALFPHMNVEDNVGFGLSVRGISRKDRLDRVQQTLRKVGLAGYGARKIHELSGGEQQRVALARALVLSPTVLLLDEPFGAIDVQLRSQLQALLREIHRSEGLTILMVTHDISEALALAEKIVVLDHGKVQQTGCPNEVLHQPRTAMVADFMGQKNVFLGTIMANKGSVVTVRTAAGDFRCQAATWLDAAIEVGQQAAYVIDAAKVRTWSKGENELDATIESRCILGSLTVIRANAPGVGSIRCEVYNGDSRTALLASDDIKLAWNVSDAFVIPQPAASYAEPRPVHSATKDLIIA